MKHSTAFVQALFLSTVICVLATGQSGTQFTLRLDGSWRCELDPDDLGVRQEWFKRSFRSPIKLPGILQSQGFGLPISTNTPWMLTLYDHFWYLRDEYKAYTE